MTADELREAFDDAANESGALGLADLEEDSELLRVFAARVYRLALAHAKAKQRGYAGFMQTPFVEVADVDALDAIAAELVGKAGRR